MDRSQRLWRLRRLHDAIDALLIERGAEGTELRIDLNGGPIYTRQWARRPDAIDDAGQRRADLEREGWMAHW